MIPQQFVDSLNEPLMPRLGYVKINGVWLFPVCDGVDGQLVTRYLYPDGTRYG